MILKKLTKFVFEWKGGTDTSFEATVSQLHPSGHLMEISRTKKRISIKQEDGWRTRDLTHCSGAQVVV